jgi:cytochrome c553
MKSIKSVSLAFAGLLLGLSASSAMAGGDVEAGKAVYARVNCASCHGADAKTPVDPSYPKLAGQYANYLAHALRSYQRGQANEAPSANIRQNPIMGAFASQLSDQDIENVTAYLASLPSELATRK